jgi:hypothetical protein
LAPLERRFAGISVFSGFEVLVGTPFRTSLDPCFRPCFRALGNPTMLPTVQKLLGRVFAHREQECPSAKGSFPRKVNKPRKAGIHEPRIPFSRRVLPSFWPTFDRRIGVLTLHEALKTGQLLAHPISQVVCLSADHLKIGLFVPALGMPLVVGDSFFKCSGDGSLGLRALWT